VGRHPRFVGPGRRGQREAVVRDAAKIEASVEASELIVMGEIRGEVQATGRIEICSGGKIFGDVQTKTLIIREGAVFEGYCRMAQRPATTATQSVAGAPQQP
jgi:cytoskeletal protein CcmA (bactofilin family)